MDWPEAFAAVGTAASFAAILWAFIWGITQMNLIHYTPQRHHRSKLEYIGEAVLWLFIFTFTYGLLHAIACEAARRG